MLASGREDPEVGERAPPCWRLNREVGDPQRGRYAVAAPSGATTRPGQPPMQAYVYKSLRKDDSYVFLAARDDFSRLPEPVRQQLGRLQFVLEVALTPERKLARADAAVVRENLVTRGFHLQLPPTSTLDPMSEDWGTDA